MALSTRVDAVASSRAVTPVHVTPRPVAPLHATHVHPDVRVLVALRHAVSGLEGPAYETLPLLPEETIKDIKVHLRNRGWFSSRHCLVFGDKETAEAIRVSDMVGSSGITHPSILHVFVKLADVDHVKIRTLKREFSLSNQAASSAGRSAPEGGAAFAESALALALPSVATADPDAGSSTPTSQAVVHLMVHKSAKVNWHHLSEDKFELSINSSDTVDSLIRKLEAAHGEPLDAESHSVLFDGQVLPSGQPLANYGVGKGSVLELVPHEPLAHAESLPDGSPLLSSPSHQLHENWQRARAGLAEGHSPRLAKAGTGGSYFLQDVEGNSVAVFKPEDEEPLAINNPKGRTPGSSSDGGGSSGEGLRRGTRPGEGAVREVAAYVLDHGHFSGVPPTALVSCFVNQASGGAVKVGSLQQFVDSEGDCEERGTSHFPTSEVHKIAVLDLRLANTDRNGGNILAQRDAGSGEWSLIPIDHGYCLPASFEDITFEWMYWQQAEQPFDETTLAYIQALDAEHDLSILAAHGLAFRPECLRVFRVCTMLLKKGAAAGLTPYQIASIMCRQGVGKSPLEKLHTNALVLAAAAGGGARVRRTSRLGDLASLELQAYLNQMEMLLDQYLEEFLLEGEDLLAY